MLRKLSETCEFGTLKNSLIKDRIVLGVNNVKTRERLLRVPDLTLEKALDVVRSAEATEKQIKELGNDASVYGVKREKITPPNWKTPRIMRQNVSRRRRSIAEIVEQDIAQGNALPMAKHVTIVTNNIIFKACACQEKTFMV